MKRILHIKGGRNFRDLGGYQTNTNQHVIWKKLVRSANLADLTKHDTNLLNKYGIKTVVDFRSENEVIKAPDIAIPEAENTLIPVLHRDETDNSKTPDELKKDMLTNSVAGVERMKDVYRKMILSNESKKAYQNFFKILLSRGDEGVLFHCTSGKDRTGLGAIFILTALDVPEETIREDYLLTNEVTAKYIEDIVKSLRKKEQSEVLINNIVALYTVNISYYLEAMNWINKVSGSRLNYLKNEIGLTNNDLNDLKKLYLN